MEISCLSAPFPVVARCSLAWLPLPGLHPSPSWHILPHLLLFLASDCALSGRLAFALAPSSWQLLYACLHVDINVDGDANGDVDRDVDGDVDEDVDVDADANWQANRRQQPRPVQNPLC